jgi:hypothetical protein
MHHGLLAELKPITGETKIGPRPDAQADDLGIEIARALQIRTAHREVFEHIDGHEKSPVMAPYILRLS